MKKTGFTDEQMVTILREVDVKRLPASAHRDRRVAADATVSLLLSRLCERDSHPNGP